jgi:hypothetical protein
MRRGSKTTIWVPDALTTLSMTVADRKVVVDAGKRTGDAQPTKTPIEC